MDTMEITKFVAAICGSLLVFLLIQNGAHAIYGSLHPEEEEVVGYEIAVEEAAPAEGEGAAEEAVDIVALMAGADAAAGEGVFRRCAACHKLDGTDGVGPHLNGVVERDIGSVAGFTYSPDLASMEGNWTPEALFHFIGDPKGYAPGTAMSFAGIPDEQDRADLIAYLQTAGQ
jgi:cytochrome c